MWCRHTCSEDWVETPVSYWPITLPAMLIVKIHTCSEQLVKIYYLWTHLGLTTCWIKLTCQNYTHIYIYIRIFHSCISCFQASFQRSNSHDKVRKIVAEEGRTARNLIAWSVPLENKDDDGMYLAVFPQLVLHLALCSLELLTWSHVSVVRFLCL